MDAERQYESRRSTYKQIILGLVAYLASIAPSMSIGFSAVALPSLSKESNIYPLNQEEASWFASVASIAAPIGCFLSGPISDRFGRRPALFCINGFSFCGWIVIAFSYNLSRFQYAALIIGRLLTGMSTGLASMPPTVYMAEIASPKLRGMLTTASSAFFSLGIMLVYVLGFIFKENWGAIALITAVLPCVSIVATFFLLPESPTWLVSKKRIDEASKNLRKIYGYKEPNFEIRADIESLIQTRNLSRIENDTKTAFSSFFKKISYLKRPSCLKPFTLVSIFFFFQQFSGCFVVVFYAIDIVSIAGVKTDHYIAICAIALMRLIGGFLSSYISIYLGRKVLSVLSGFGMAVATLLLTLHLHYNLNNWIPIFSLSLYFFAGSIGFVTVPFAMAAECFPARIRGTATGLITCINYFLNFVIVKIFPDLRARLGGEGVFLFFGVACLAGTIFVAVFLPETKGKTLAEIEEYFGGRKKENTKVAQENVS